MKLLDTKSIPDGKQNISTSKKSIKQISTSKSEQDDRLQKIKDIACDSINFSITVLQEKRTFVRENHSNETKDSIYIFIKVLKELYRLLDLFIEEATPRKGGDSIL